MKLKTIVILVILHTLGCLLVTVYGCSCVEGSFERSETEAIQSDFCWASDVYVATVLEATCNCLPDPSDNGELYCQTFSGGGPGSSDANVETVARATCDQNFYTDGLRACSELQRYDEQQFSNLIRPGITVTATGTMLPPLVNVTGSLSCLFYACPFNNNSSSDVDFIEFQPCSYTVTVDQIFKDSANDSAVGNTLTVTGPDVLTSCGSFGRVVELGEQYVVGIGGACNPISEWTPLDDYSDRGIELLEQLGNSYPDDPSICAGPKLSVFHFSLPLLLTLIPLLLYF